MKKMKALLALLLFAASVAFAGLQRMDSGYVVQKGDTAWELAGVRLGDPKIWRQIVIDNPMLQQPGRVFERGGKTIVILRPGEQLYGLEKYVPVLPMPIETKTVGTLTNTLLSSTSDDADWSWLWWLIALVAGFALLAYLINRRLNKPAATSGPPMVTGGVNERTAADQFLRRAAEQHQAATGQAIPAQQFTFVEQPTSGRVTGIMNVRYADGREVPRRLNGEQAYRARVRFPDGREETLFMLRACGNDLRYGGISRYLPGPSFRFVPDAEAEPPQAPQPAPAPAPQPAAEGQVQQQGSMAHLQPLADNVVFELRPASGNRPALLRFRQEMQVEVSDAGVVSLRLPS